MFILLIVDRSSNIKYVLHDMSEANEDETFNILTSEFLNSLTSFGLPNHKTKPIQMIINNTIVTKIANHVLEVKIMLGKNIGHIIYIFIPISTICQTYRKTIPCIYIYAMIINKSQGQSLESLRLYLQGRIFSHNQLFIVISKVKSKKILKILIHDKDGNPLKSITNVVYKEVFQNL
ncbi:hypothetical protein Lal_00032435 [Lupinus albus]|nr:hypothetical protein Lal_00032435 [Lupinus albus]